MKTKLTIEESARLIELGVDAKLASFQECVTGTWVFTLTDILSILPKEIDDYYLNISAYMAEWCVSYERTSCCDNFEIKCSRSAPELIDALNQLAIWAIEQGHLKTEKQ